MFISFSYLLICTLPYVYSFELQQTALRTYSKMHMLSESEEPMEMNIIPPRYKKKQIQKAQWFPLLNINAPVLLDGTLAGDVGFDPLGFASSKKTLYWMREAEVKHARLAMLAAIGWPLSELWHEELAQILHMDSLLASGNKAPSIINGGLSNVYASGMLMASIVVAGLLEKKAMDSGEIFWNNEKPNDYVPGDYGFDPLDLYTKRSGDKKSMETAELKNGRLAMIAITTYVFEEIITGLPVVQQTSYLF